MRLHVNTLVRAAGTGYVYCMLHRALYYPYLEHEVVALSESGLLSAGFASCELEMCFWQGQAGAIVYPTPEDSSAKCIQYNSPQAGNSLLQPGCEVAFPLPVH